MVKIIHFTVNVEFTTAHQWKNKQISKHTKWKQIEDENKVPIRKRFPRLSRLYETFTLCVFSFDILKFQGYIRKICFNCNPALIKQNIIRIY